MTGETATRPYATQLLDGMTDVRPRRRARAIGARVLAAFVAVLLGGAAAALVPSGPASAAVVQWGTNGGQAPNYQTSVNGDFISVGNGVLGCSGSPLGSGTGTCSDLHLTTGAINTNEVNDNFQMVNSNTVSGFTTNSSSASLTVPSGATVVKAFLNWSANTGSYAGDTRALCTGFSSARGAATLPAGSATGYQTRAVQFKVGSGSIISEAPDTLLEDPSSQATARYYSATSDITSAFANVATGSPVTISAGNIWAPTGPGCYAGWSLTVVYDYGQYILGNSNSVPHRIIYYFGHVREGASDDPLSVDFNGFTAVATGTRASFTLYEGDRGITGDTASYSRSGGTGLGAVTGLTEIRNSANAAGNVGVGRAAGSVRYTGTGSDANFTNQSVDVTDVSLGNVIAGDNKVTLQLGTSGDSYLLTNAALSVPTAGLQVTKTYVGTTDQQYRTAGEKATFTITITNTGAGTLTNIQVVDDQADCSRTVPTNLGLLGTYTYQCTATNPTTASYTSTATVTARTLIGNFLAQDDDSTRVLLSAMTLSKTSALAAGATGKAGDALVYSYLITNTGGGPLSGIALTDNLSGLGPITGVPATLAAGASGTATASYTLTQADVDAGSVINNASVSGVDADQGINPTATATRTTPLASSPALTLVKTGALANGATGKVGDKVNYGFTITNSGNVTLTGVAVADPKVTGTIAYTWPTGTAGRLAPGQSATGTISYTITQADVDAGSVKNTATVTGTTPTHTTTTGTSNQVTVPTIAAAPALVTTKTASRAGTGAVGDVITYTFTARNAGNVTLSGVTIADPLSGLTALSPAGPVTLAPGATYTATATYAITQADVDRGSVVNQATGSATSPSGGAVSSTSAQVTTPTLAAAPGLSLSKTGSAAGATTGSVVTYSFRLTNSGNVTVTGAAISDPLVGLSTIAYGAWPGATGTLAPGQFVTATATYALKQSDVDAGAVANTSTATAKPLVGANVTQTASATVPVAPTGALVVTKSGAYTNGTGAVGSTVTWTITFRNSGNVTLNQLVLSDTLSGLSTPVIAWPAGQTAGTLAPGQTATATATSTVTQADVDAGSVKNTATVTGRSPAGAPVTGSSPVASVATPTAAPGLGIVKTGAIAGGAAGNAGDVIVYTFTLRNTGNVTLTGVTAADPLGGLGALAYTWPGATGTLAPGQTATATANYTIKQTDVNAGNVKNTATASGTAPGGAAGGVTATSGQVTTSTAAATPGIAVSKSGTLPAGSTGAAGDVVTWTVRVTNSGNVTLTTVGVTDPTVSALTPSWPAPASPGILQPGQTATFVGTQTLTQADVDSGSVANVATGRGTTPANTVLTNTGSGTVPLTARAALGLTKTASPASGVAAGQTVTYTLKATNSGNVTLTGVVITDPLTGLSSAPVALTPGQTTTATSTYVVKQTDVDTGSIANTASVTGKPPTGANATATASANVTTAAPAPALTTTKTAAVGGTGSVGDVITYTVVSTNSGNVTLRAVTVSDPLLTLTPSWPGTAGVLAPGQKVTATGTYRITQADVNTGSVTNQASASGTSPGGTTVTGPSPTVVTKTATSAPAISLTKSGSASAPRAGGVITYSFTFKNTGNVTLTGATITDPLVGLSRIAIAWPAGTDGILAPQQQVTGTATYTITQADVDAGSVSNTATATAAPPTGAPVSMTAPATVNLAAAGALAVTKSGAYTTGSGAVGSVITWSIQITNTGNVTLTQVVLSDSLSGLSTPSITWPAGQTAGTLAPGQVATATATSTVTQTDVDTGSVTNTATATGRAPGGAAIVGASPAAKVTTQPAAGALALVKTGTIGGGAAGNAGDVIVYRFTATNTGNVTLTGVTIADPLAGLGTLTCTWPTATAGTLAPGQKVTASANYTLKQSDVNAGGVKNTATTSGTAPGGAPAGGVTASSGQVTTSTAPAAPAVVVTKTGVLAPGATGVAGDTVRWSFTLRNSGNVTLTGASIADTLTGLSTLAYVWPTATDGLLDPGQQATATATSTLLQSDVDAGAVSNTATGSGASPLSGTVTSTPSSATVAVVARAAISLTKTASPTSGVALNGTVTYTFVVRNTGNVTLTGVAVTDPHPRLSTITPGAWPDTAKPNVLTPGQSVTETTTYVAVQADVDSGTIGNTATASGTAPDRSVVTATASASVATVPSAPAISIAKSAAVAGGGGVGSTITYTFTARNTGNVTLSGVTIGDPHNGLSPLSYSWPNAPNVLAPGQVVSATATYTITQADVNTGSVTNTATASGTPPTGPAVTGTSPTVVTPTIAADPRITLSKTGSANGTTAGSTISYGFTLTNTGNVTLKNAAITDPLVGAVAYGTWPSGTAGVLEPGASVTATATYTLAQTDVDAGAVSNAATASAQPPTGANVGASASKTVAIAGAGALTLTKAANPTTGVAVGQTVTYSFTATNTGNVTLTGVAITDPHAGLSTVTYGAWPGGVTGTLAPGATVTATATYVATQADVNTGSIANTATVAGRSPSGLTATATASRTVTTVAAAPSIQAGKSAVVSGQGALGDRITYTLTAKNTGNVTLTGVALSDSMFTAAQLDYGVWPSGTAGTLQPGQTIAATAIRTITQGDVDTGSVTNTAHATGTPPNGAPAVASDSPTVVTPVTQTPAITLNQTGALQSGSTGRVGDVVTWTFTITNSGSTTLSNVAVVPGLAGVTGLAYGTWPSGTANALAPGQSVTATATSMLTQAQVDAGTISDPATASGTGPTTVSSSKQATVTYAPVSSLTLQKTVSPTSVPGQTPTGTVLTYTFTAKNTGATTLSGVAIADPHARLSALVYGTWPSGTPNVLAPGQSVTATATYAVADTDVEAGSVVNTATVAGTAPGGVADAVKATSPTVTVPVGNTPGIAVTKSARYTTGTGGVNSVITYTITATNTGNISLTGVSVSDTLAGLSALGYSWPGPANTLAVGASVTATATYTLTQADVDRGSVANQATATGTPTSPAGSPAVTATSAVVQTTTAPSAPAISLVKTATLTSGTGTAGSTVRFDFSVTNTGNVTLTGVQIADSLQGLGTVTGLATTLAPNATTSASATYTVTQADVDAGAVSNVGTATGTPQVGAVASATNSATVVLTRTNTLTLTKSAEPTIAGGVGSTLTYTLVARNAGTTTLRGVTINDALAGLGTIAYGTWPNGQAGVLPPGTEVSATASYTVTQADVDTGRITNAATATASGPDGSAVDATSNTVQTSTPAADPRLTVQKTADLTTGAVVGDVVHYAIVVTNAGNVTLSAVGLSDSLLTGTAAPTVSWPGATGVLAPGQKATATGAYQVTQADVDAGSVLNTATATGTPPTGAPVSATGSATTSTTPPAATIAITDAGALDAGATGRVGDVVTWTYVIRNTGNVTLTGVDATESQSGASTPAVASWPGATGTLRPGQSVTATSHYTLTQADVDRGSVASAVATKGFSTNGGNPTANATANVAIAAHPSLGVTKTGIVRSPGTGRVGDTVRFTITATNTGNVTLYQAAVADAFAGLSAPAYTWPGAIGVLAPGDEVTATADYVLQQGDVDAGSVRNVATATAYTTPTGTDPANRVTGVSPAATVATVQAAPALGLAKSGTITSGTGGPDSVVTWTVTATNTGNVTLTGIALADPTLGDPHTAWDGGVDGTLAPGAHAVLTGTTTIAQPDVDAGSVSNIATATAGFARDATTTPVVAAPASATVPTAATMAAITVAKTAKHGTGWNDKAGDPVDLGYTITNTGNVTLTGVTLTEPLLLTGPIAYGTWPSGTAGTLAPGQSVTASAIHDVTPAEVNAGTSGSTVTVTGTPPNAAPPVSASDQAAVSIASKPDMHVTDTSAVSGAGGVGDTITYTFTVTNTGNVQLDLVQLFDSLAGTGTLTIDWPDEQHPGLVLPGQTATATVEYAIVQADVDAGSITNVATASGKPPIGDTILRSSDPNVTKLADPKPALTVTKDASPASGVVVGGTIAYTIVATNTGNVTLHGVDDTDSLSGIGTLIPTWPGATGVLAPGQHVTWKAGYTVTQADVDAGSIANTATASGLPPTGAAVSATASATTTVAPTGASIQVVDSGVLAAGSTGRAGDTVNWTYVITNTGDVTLSAVDAIEQLTDATAPVYGAWPDPTRPNVLPPHQSVTVTTTSKLTTAQVDAGSVNSTVSTRGTPPQGARVTDAATATVLVTAAPSYTVVKSATFLNGGTGQLGDTIEYSLVVVNTGNVTLSNARLRDPLPNLGEEHPTWPTPAQGVIPAGMQATGYADYVVSQADIDRGFIDNVATVDLDTPAGVTVEVKSNAVHTVLAESVPALTVTKTGVATNGGAVGGVVTWTIKATNSGNVTLEGVAVTDDLPLQSTNEQWPGITGTLTPGDTVTVTGTTVLTQADIDRGSVTNTAHAAGTSSRDHTTLVRGNDPTATVPTANAAAAIHVDKSAAMGQGWSDKAGDIVEWTYKVTNSGNTTLSGVALQDALPTVDGIHWAGGTPGPLAPGATATATASYALTQSDVDRGSVQSSVTATGNPPRGAAAVSDTASAGVAITEKPGMSLGTASSTSGGAGVGDRVDYVFTIVNTGNTTLTLVDLIDALGGVTSPAFTWPHPVTPGVVGPGEQVIATSSYAITQADVDRGSVTATATATGKPPVGDTISVSDTKVTTLAAERAELTVGKTATPTSGVAAGGTVQYAITVTNTGNVTMHGIQVTDPLVGSGEFAVTWPSAEGVLAPGKSATANASYRATQADVDAGSILNVANATGLSPSGTSVTGQGTATVTTATARPAITVTDTGALAPGAAGVAGDTVTWSYTVTNSGNVTLTGIGLVEALPTVDGIHWTAGAAPAQLAPGQSATATATSSLTQAQVDAGTIHGSVAAAGTPPGSNAPAVADTATADVAIAAHPAMTVVKSGTIVAPGIGAVGDQIEYSLVITNTGNVTLHNGRLEDPLPGLGTLRINWPTATDGDVPPGAQVTGSADYPIVQADVDKGAVDNTARVSATTTTDPNGARTFATSNPVHVATVEATPALTVTKSATVTGQRGAGEVVHYTITTRNTGDVTVSGIAVADPMSGLSPLTTTWPTATDGTLAPGAEATTTADYTITQADVDQGAITNVATATGTPARGGASVTGTSRPLVTPTAPAAPRLEVTDRGSLAGGATVGGTVTWSYTIANRGNVTLTGVALADALPGVTAPQYPAGFDGVLAPGKDVAVTATSTLQQSDVDAGAIISTVHAHGTPRVGGDAVADATDTVTLVPSPALTLVKTGALRTPGANGLGDTVVFSFDLANTGNVTLHGATITDSLAGLSTPQLTWPGAVGILAAGQHATGTATYQLSQRDLDAGSIANQATATALTPANAAVPQVQSQLVTVTAAAAAPALSAVKSATVLNGGTGAAGDTVRFAIAIKNTGNVSVSNLAVSDPLTGSAPISIAYPAGATSIDPGQTATATVDYVLLQSDVDRGSVDNQATVTGTPGRAGTPPVSATSNLLHVTTTPPRPAIGITQSGAFELGTKQLGDTVDYTFTLTNTGNTTLNGIALTDTVSGLTGLSSVPTTLAPGATATVTARHLVTQADVDAGVIRNTESVRAADPSGGPVTATTTELVLPLVVSSDLRLVKTGVARGDGGAGDTIDYTLTLSNNGNQTVTGATIADGLPGTTPLVYGSWPNGGPVDTLPPGTSVTATLSYVVTQADVDAGAVVNTASASATSSGGTSVATVASASTVRTATSTPKIAITKKEALAAGARGKAGDRVDFAFQVTNTGNVTLDGVTLGDAQVGLGPVAYRWPGTPGVLKPGQVLDATASYQLTQADVDRGTLTSTATTEGDGVRGGTVSADAQDPLVLAQTAGLTLAKTATTVGTPVAGSTVTFGYTLTNTGTTTLDGVAIADAYAGLSGIAYHWPGINQRLEPGDVATATATATITPADVTAGAVTNTATASATSPAGAVSAAPASATLPIPHFAIALGMSVAIAGGAPGYAGDTLVYTYVITNTGSSRLTGIALADPKPGLGAFRYGAWPSGIAGVLDPGQSVTVTADYVIQPGDQGTVVPASATVTAAETNAGLPVAAAAQAPIRLPDPPPPLGAAGLAVTGIEVGVPIGLAILFLGWGGALLALGTRRKETTP